MSDRGQRTEQPTPRRLDRARKDGRFPVSRELVGAAQFLIFAALLAFFGGAMYSRIAGAARTLFREAFTAELTLARVVFVSNRVAREVFFPFGATLLSLAGFALLVQLASTRFGLSLKGLAPSFGRLNPMQKLRGLPRQNGPAFFSALALLPLFLAAVYAVAADRFGTLKTLPLASAERGASEVAAMIQDVIWKAAGLFIVMGVIDLWRQRRRYVGDLKMSKQEVREELKEQEGNPQVKGRIRRIQRDLLRRRMMQQVPKATVVVVNPTHYAVAIRYSMESMGAPAVVAKGKNYLALRIRKMASEHQVPIVENPPLAQALYKSCEVGQEIPAHLYRAVAEILAYLYRLMGGRLPG